MTTATLAAGNRTMTEVRPRRSLEELVDRLFAAMGFKDETENGGAEPDAEYPRGSTTQAGGGPRIEYGAGSRRGAGGLRRHGHGEGDD